MEHFDVDIDHAQTPPSRLSSGQSLWETLVMTVSSSFLYRHEGDFTELTVSCQECMRPLKLANEILATIELHYNIYYYHGQITYHGHNKANQKQFQCLSFVSFPALCLQHWKWDRKQQWLHNLAAVLLLVTRNINTPELLNEINICKCVMWYILIKGLYGSIISKLDTPLPSLAELLIRIYLWLLLFDH